VATANARELRKSILVLMKNPSNGDNESTRPTRPRQESNL
jgi:hypothetical protein